MCANRVLGPRKPLPVHGGPRHLRAGMLPRDEAAHRQSERRQDRMSAGPDRRVRAADGRGSQAVRWMRRPRLIGTVGLVATGASLISGCGSSKPTLWHGLRNVYVSVSRPSLPPPRGLPRFAKFNTPAQVRHAIRLLNAHHITRVAKSPPLTCAGGENIAITAARVHGPPIGLSAYRCGGRSSALFRACTLCLKIC